MTSIFEDRIQVGLNDWLAIRNAQTAKQLASGRVDAGTRGAVTGGAHLHSLTQAVSEMFVASGIQPRSIKARGMELPGFYRPSKNWDLVVVEDDVLVAAIEFKSQVGSFGNNFNNRTEEAIGNAIDLRKAYKAGFLGTVPPWIGYVFVLEDSPKSANPVRVARTPFPTDSVFTGASYQDRYQLLFRRLVREGLYDAACFLTQSQVPATAMSQPDLALSIEALERAIAERVTFIKGVRSLASIFRACRRLDPSVERWIRLGPDTRMRAPAPWSGRARPLFAMTSGSPPSATIAMPTNSGVSASRKSSQLCTFISVLTVPGHKATEATLYGRNSRTVSAESRATAAFYHPVAVLKR